ncbi:MAG: NAD(+)/NADH kinase [Clostridiales bacterium]|nr:NAD(+)/NADH kinase [Clostridiales bacterium]
MKTGLISLFTNETELSADVELLLRQKLTSRGYKVTEGYDEEAELLICIGGDGAFLRTMHRCDFPETPIVGINTGHLGFFQEVWPEDFDTFIEDYEHENYTIQKLGTVMGIATTADGTTNTHIGLNEIAITGSKSYTIHFDLSIGDKPIERFSGDGILVATSAGSTAYNYSVGGSIVDPRLNLLQVTPLAPMNTTAFRSFTSSIMLPSDLTLGIVPEESDKTIYITNDGIENEYDNLKEIKVSISDKSVNLIRFSDYDFWSKVKDKFL